MTTKLALRLSVLLLGVSLAAPARATTNVFPPFSGDHFKPITYSTTAAVMTDSGSVTNTSASDQTVEAPLGHALGGSNGFFVFGRMTAVGGGTVSCSIYVLSTVNGTFQPTATNSITTFGRFSFFVGTSPPGGNYFYTMRCTLSHGAQIDGVRPDA